MTNNVRVAIALCVLGIGVLPPHLLGADTMSNQRRNHIAGRPLFYSKNMDPGIPTPPILDETILLVRNGQKVSNETVEKCVQANKAYYSDVFLENDVQRSWDLLEADRVNVVIVEIKLSVISPEKHLYVSAEYRHLFTFLPDAIKRRRLVDDDPFLALCAIFPAVMFGDFDSAIEAYTYLLEKDPFLAHHAVKCHEARGSHDVGNERSAEFLKRVKALPSPTR